MAKKNVVTIQAIATAANVSIATVSKALNGRPGVSAEKRLAIKEAAERLAYQPYVKARGHGMLLRGGRHVAVLIGPVGSHINREIQRGIDQALRASGLFAVCCNLLPEDPEKAEFQKVFLEKIADDPSIVGLLAACTDVSDPVLARLKEAGVPTVLMDSPRRTELAGRVMIDHTSGGRAACQALLSIGRRTLGYIGPRPDLDRVWAERWEGAKEAAKRGRARLVYAEESFTDIDASAAVTARLLERQPDTDGIVFASDRQMAGGVRALREIDREVPGQVAVIGFDDSDFCRAFSPSLSSVRQPFRRLGETGARMLLKAVKSGARSRGSKVLPVEVIARDSTRGARRER